MGKIYIVVMLIAANAISGCTPWPVLGQRDPFRDSAVEFLDSEGITQSDVLDRLSNATILYADTMTLVLLQNRRESTVDLCDGGDCLEGPRNYEPKYLAVIFDRDGTVEEWWRPSGYRGVFEDTRRVIEKYGLDQGRGQDDELLYLVNGRTVEIAFCYDDQGPCVIRYRGEAELTLVIRDPHGDLDELYFGATDILRSASSWSSDLGRYEISQQGAEGV